MCDQFHCGFAPSLQTNGCPEVGYSVFQWKVTHPTDCMISLLRRKQFEYSWPGKLPEIHNPITLTVYLNLQWLKKNRDLILILCKKPTVYWLDS
jgi:hypothetical protein